MAEKFNEGDRVSLKDGSRYDRPLEQCVGVVDKYERYHGTRVWIRAEDALYYAYPEDQLALIERKAPDGPMPEPEPEPGYFYSTATPHQWSSGATFHQYDPEVGGKIASLERAKELAEKAQVGAWGEERFVKTTYGVSYDANKQ